MSRVNKVKKGAQDKARAILKKIKDERTEAEAAISAEAEAAEKEKLANKDEAAKKVKAANEEDAEASVEEDGEAEETRKKIKSKLAIEEDALTKQIDLGPSDDERLLRSAQAFELFSKLYTQNLPAHAVTVLDKAKEQVKKEIRDYLDDLYKKFEKSKAEQAKNGDPEPEQILNSLKTLDRWNAWSNFCYGSARVVQTGFTSLKHHDPKLLAELGHNVVRISRHMDALFEDPAVGTWGRIKNVGTVIKSFAYGCIDYVVGGLRGAVQGFVDGKGALNSVKGFFTGGIRGAVSGGFSGFADGLNEKDHLNHLIAHIQAKHKEDLAAAPSIDAMLIHLKKEKAKGEPVDDQIAEYEVSKARIDVIKEESAYVAELRAKSQSQDPKVVSQALRSLRVLDWANAGASLLHAFLNVLMSSKVYDAKTAKEMGKDILSTTKSFNDLCDTDKIRWPLKLGIMFKAYITAVVSGLAGMITGFVKGLFKDGIYGAISGIFVGGWSQFWKGFSESYKESLTKRGIGVRSEQAEIELSELRKGKQSDLVEQEPQLKTQPPLLDTGKAQIDAPTASGREPAKEQRQTTPVSVATTSSTQQGAIGGVQALKKPISKEAAAVVVNACRVRVAQAQLALREAELALKEAELALQEVRIAQEQAEAAAEEEGGEFALTSMDDSTAALGVVAEKEAPTTEENPETALQVGTRL